ncbi:GNAT family N-acetyltransferase [Pseudovibrio hongkongensis]|uniref:GNAT family N-acetyltransferase n=1 Tax=Polycladidibacter hongkongensis TaxID=1647556 RepID=UPI00082B5380
MSEFQFSMRHELPEDLPVIEEIQEEAFGPGRFTRTSYRIREAGEVDERLSFVAEVDGVLSGSVRLTPIFIGETDALLLGPLAVRPPFKGMGIGRALMQRAAKAAADAEAKFVLLVGDYEYYAQLGYEQVGEGQITLPGPVDPARLLLLRLKGGVIPCGPVRAVPPTSTAQAE